MTLQTFQIFSAKTGSLGLRRLQVLKKAMVENRWLAVFIVTCALDLAQGFSTGALGPPWGLRSGSPGATSRGLY